MDFQSVLDVFNFWSVILVLIIAYLTYRLVSTPRNIPPGPWGVPLLGALYKIDVPNFHKDLKRFGDKYGDVYSLYFGTRLKVVLNSNKAIREAFFERGDDYSNRQPFFVNTISNFQDEIFTAPFHPKFKDRKKFAFQALKSSGLGTRLSESKLLTEVNELTDFLTKQDSKALDLTDIIYNTTGNVMSSILFNNRYAWDDEELREVIDGSKRLFEGVSKGVELDFISQYLPISLMRVLFRSKFQSIETSFSIVINYLMRKIKEHRETFDPNDMRDYLDFYIRDRSDDPDFSDHIFACTAALFTADGVATLGDIIHWMFFYLAYYPEEQKKCQDEIDQVCGKGQPIQEHRKQLPTIEAFMTEVLRVTSIFPILAEHTATRATTFRGYNIPVDNCQIIANIYASNNDESVFENPHKFDSTRFIGAEGKLKDTDKVMDFGIGRRACMGELFSKTLTFLVTSNILQKFTLQFPDNEPKPSQDPDPKSFSAKPQCFKICALPRN